MSVGAWFDRSKSIGHVLSLKALGLKPPIREGIEPNRKVERTDPRAAIVAPELEP
jgi:hypothetical protein